MATAPAQAAERRSPCAPDGGDAWDYANRDGKRRDERRRERFDALRALWDFSTLERVRKCRRVPHNSHVSLNLREDGTAEFGGLTSCGSVWACPRCSARIWAERGDDLTRALDTWHEMGGSVAMVTLTMRHHAGQRLEDLWSALSGAWAAAASQNRKVRRLQNELGVYGWTRVVEVTHGSGAGWHVHTHALMFMAPPCELPRGAQQDAERASAAATRLGDAMFEGWSLKLQAAGLDAPIKDKGGLDVRALDLTNAREAVASYQVKATYERAAYELTGNAGKDARMGNRTPWGILRAFVQNGDCADLALWQEWEAGSKGRRALTWSRGLRALLALDAERADDEIAEDESQGAVLVGLVAKDDWAKVCAMRHAPARLLEALEGAAERASAWVAATALLCEWGLSPPSLSPP